MEEEEGEEVDCAEENQPHTYSQLSADSRQEKPYERDVKRRANLFELLKLKSINAMLVQETHNDFK